MKEEDLVQQAIERNNRYRQERGELLRARTRVSPFRRMKRLLGMVTRGKANP